MSEGSSWQNVYCILYMLGTTTKLSVLFKFWGCSSSTCTFEKILFLHLGLTVTEINTKKYRNKKIKNIKNVGMACQKVCKQGRDDVCMYVNKGQTPWQSPMPTSFSHYSWIVHESYLVAI